MTSPILDEDPLGLEAYRARAGANPKPADHTEPELTPELVAAVEEALAAGTATFFADISEFQVVINSAYKISKMIAFRLDNGNRLDKHAVVNWAYCSAEADVVLCYVVFKPGQLNAVMARIKSVLGPVCPIKVAIMLDMESGGDFAGPGNHSMEANQWAMAFATYGASNWRKAYPYANAPDYASCWPQMDARLVRKHTAKYSTTGPGTYGWQYFGGLTQYASPAGYPRSCEPFGSWVDMNVIFASIAQIKIDLGMVAPTPPWNHPAVPSGPTTIKSPYTLGLGQALISPSKHYVAQFQTDGNLVVRNWVTGHADWASQTNGKGATRLAIQGDGNLVVYAPDGKGGLKAVWSSGTALAGSPNRPVYLVQQDDGNLVLRLQSNSAALWSSQGGKIRTVASDEDQPHFLQVVS